MQETTPKEKKDPASMELDAKLSSAITFFVLVTLQFPLFVLKNDAGELRGVSPMEVCVSELLMTRAVPEPVLKTLLYPGAQATAADTYFKCISSKSPKCSKAGLLPDMDTVLEGIKPLDKMMSKQLQKQKMLMIAASFFNVVGGIIAPLFATKLILFGVGLTFWSTHASNVQLASYFYATIPCAFISTEFGVRDTTRKRRRTAAQKAAAAAGDRAAAAAEEGEEEAAPGTPPQERESDPPPTPSPGEEKKDK